MDALLKNIRKIFPISKNSSEQLKGIFKEKKFKKKAPLSFKNHISTKFYIVKSGILRSFITDNNGKEFIKFIYTKHSVVGAFGSLIRKKYIFSCWFMLYPFVFCDYCYCYCRYRSCCRCRRRCCCCEGGDCYGDPPHHYYSEVDCMHPIASAALLFKRAEASLKESSNLREGNGVNENAATHVQASCCCI